MAGGIYLHKATIRGRGAFPTDMLRYDSCFPADSRSVEVLNHTEKGEEWAMEVHKISRGAKVGFTQGRWQSFGVSIQEKAPVSL